MHLSVCLFHWTFVCWNIPVKSEESGIHNKVFKQDESCLLFSKAE